MEFMVNLLAWGSKFWKITSYAVGMAVARPYDFEIDFVRYPFSESARFFGIILKFIYALILKFKIWTPENDILCEVQKERMP